MASYDDDVGEQIRHGKSVAWESTRAIGDFGRLPGRALSDGDLHGSELRLLAYIGFRDRTSAGCYATQLTMAAQLGINRVTVATALRTLQERGYIRAERAGETNSLRYFVIWLPDEDAIDGQR